MAKMLSQFQKKAVDFSPRPITSGSHVKYTRYVKLRTKQSSAEPSKKKSGTLRSSC